MGMVKLGHDNIELWTKQLREPQYSQQLLTVFGEIEEPNIKCIITTPNFGQSPPKGREKPYNYNTQQQQTTPQEKTNEVTNEATSNNNIFQGINEATSNHNIFQRITDEAGSKTTPNPNIFQGIINDVESEITIS